MAPTKALLQDPRPVGLPETSTVARSSSLSNLWMEFMDLCMYMWPCMSGQDATL